MIDQLRFGNASGDDGHLSGGEDAPAVTDGFEARRLERRRAMVTVIT
ncbi:hypothetical protein [Roseiflexus castenholzii]